MKSSKVFYYSSLKKLVRDLEKKTNTIFFIDKNVLRLFPILENLNPRITLKVDERLKTIDIINSLSEKLLRMNVNRQSTICCIGGGTLSDSVGFLSSIFMRGVSWINIPTTLLSQIDSSIGGKVGINLNEYKNILGQFHLPSQVLVHHGFIKTLTQKELLSGQGELYKYGVIRNIKLSLKATPKVIKECIQYKEKIIEKDFFDTKGKRKVLNFGHTLAHALEKVEGSKKWSHGEAVFRGCDFNLFLSSQQPKTSLVKKYRISKISPSNISLITKAMLYDKKNDSKEITVLLRNDMGQVFEKKFSLLEMKKRLTKYVQYQ